MRYSALFAGAWRVCRMDGEGRKTNANKNNQNIFHWKPLLFLSGMSAYSFKQVECLMKGGRESPIRFF